MVGLGLGLGGEWLLAVWAAVVYVGMHVFEITQRGHCYLSADSTAFPVSLLLFSHVVVGMWAAGQPPDSGKPILLAWGIYCVVFIGGHIVALAYSAALVTALTFVLRGRIATERESQAEQKKQFGVHKVR